MCVVFDCEDKGDEGAAIIQGLAFSATDSFGYFLLASEYTQRSLVHERDILNAFSGILHKIHGSEHHFGLPLHNFSSASWGKTVDGKYPSRPKSAVGCFPSCSWSSVANKIDFDCRTRSWYDTFNVAASLAQCATPTFKDDKQLLSILCCFLGKRDAFMENFQKSLIPKLHGKNMMLVSMRAGTISAICVTKHILFIADPPKMSGGVEEGGFPNEINGCMDKSQRY
ncbi:uncharacterized protein Bfra_002188 [Botrytis fragariae]|uniref:Uncharacterized protein n=1 Tax=Botrytis fragariae TaxID=1964551 RepID=A0A8H6EML9_9HELO|nr:uncharacterized protein Bfra_002188 [Botrytis fragariae]KAF5877818.1 hypothetical protein Bfra_002188 [Botrytis fragariae]